MRVDVDAEAVDADDASLLAEERALHLRGAARRRYAHGDERRVVRRLLLANLRYLDAARLCHTRRVDVVDLTLEDGIEHPLENGGREEARIDLGDLAVVDDLDLRDGALGEGARRTAELLGERDVGADHAHDFLGDRCHVDRREHRLTAQGGTDALRHVHRYADLRLHRGRTEMRCEDDAGHIAQGAVLREWLALKDVDRRPRDDPLAHGLSEIVLVDDAAARAVYEANALLHPPHLCHGDHAARLLRERHVHRDEVRLRDDVVERPDGHAECLCPLLVDVWVIGDHIHVEGEGALRDAAADTPHADDAERLAAQLNADVCLAVPLPRVHGRVCRRDVARHGEHHRDRVLRRGDRISARRVDDDDAALRCCLYVNVVHTDAGAPNDLQFPRTFQDIRRYLRRRAHHQRVIVSDHVQQFLMRDLITHIDLIVRQEADTLRRNPVRSQNLHLYALPMAI